MFFFSIDCFIISGYQACQKWLKDRRGRTLSVEDKALDVKITVALHETIRLMGELDSASEEYGGLPETFSWSGKEKSVAAN